MKDQLHTLIDLLPEEEVETAYYAIRELLIQNRMKSMKESRADEYTEYPRLVSM